MNTSEFELTAKIKVSVPETIEVFGEKVRPQYESDDEGDWIEYNGGVYVYDGDSPSETEWNIHIELDGEGLYVRATVDDIVIHEEITRMHCGLEHMKSRDTMTRYVKLVSEMVDMVIRTKLAVKRS